jgi:hypothetical protein
MNFARLLPVAAAIALTGPLSQANAQATRTPARHAPVHMAFRLIRSDSTTAAVAPAETVIANLTLNTIDGNTATIAVNGGELSYSISVAPTVGAAGDHATLLWNVRIAGHSLPGASTVAVTGASEIAVGKETGIATFSVTDPATGKSSVFSLRGTTTVDVAVAPAPK